MKTFKQGIISASALIFLAGCGGGGNSEPKFEGAFSGSLSNGVLLTDLVLGDGSFWSVSKSPFGDIHGFSKGKVILNNGSFNVTYTDFAKPGDKPVSGNGAGTYTSTSAAGSITERGETLTFEITAIPTKNYIYGTPASITSIVGPWSGKLLDGEDASVDILADGIFSSSSKGCQFNGKFEPTGVNVFNVSVNFGGPPCASPGGNASGIGVNVLGDDGKSQLIVAVVNSAQPAGSLFYASR